VKVLVCIHFSIDDKSEVPEIPCVLKDKKYARKNSPASPATISPIRKPKRAIKGRSPNKIVGVINFT